MSKSVHPPAASISEVLKETARSAPAGGLTIRELLERLGDNGLFMLCIILTVPFLLPVSIPGTSTPFGLLIALIGISLLTDRSPWLPSRLLNHRLSSDRLRLILERGARFFHRIERWTFPRLPVLTASRMMRAVNGSLLTASAILMMAPLPLPLSNTLPAYGVLFLAAGCMGRDGYLLAGGYAMVALTILYFSLVAVFGMFTFQTLLQG